MANNNASPQILSAKARAKKEVFLYRGFCGVFATSTAMFLYARHNVLALVAGSLALLCALIAAKHQNIYAREAKLEALRPRVPKTKKVAQPDPQPKIGG